jgi:hypothetical protein
MLRLLRQGYDQEQPTHAANAQSRVATAGSAGSAGRRASTRWLVDGLDDAFDDDDQRGGAREGRGGEVEVVGSMEEEVMRSGNTSKAGGLGGAEGWGEEMRTRLLQMQDQIDKNRRGDDDMTRGRWQVSLSLSLCLCLCLSVSLSLSLSLSPRLSSVSPLSSLGFLPDYSVASAPGALDTRTNARVLDKGI